MADKEEKIYVGLIGKKQMLMPMTRREAIEVMAKSFWPWDFFPSEIDEGKGWNDLNNWQKDKYRGQAKQALDALLEGVKK